MVIVYSKPNCVQCSATFRALENEEIEFETKELDDDTIENFKKDGHLQAPVVVTDADTWAGFRPDKIKEMSIETTS